MKIDHFREIINANYEIGTEEESEINTGSISSFEIARNVQKSGDKLYICFEIMKMRKSNMTLFMKNAYC